VEGLFVDRKNSHLGSTEKTGIVERAYFQNNGRQIWSPSNEMCATFRTEFSNHRLLKIVSRKLLGCSLGIAETTRRHEQKQLGTASADVLAFPAMTLRPQYGLALSDIANSTAIATAFKLCSLLCAARIHASLSQTSEIFSMVATAFFWKRT
jgi:hypothetical protein